METSVPILASLSAGTLSGGGGGAAPSRFSSTHLPRTGGEVRVGYDETVRIAPCVRTPPRCPGIESYALEFLAVYARNSVMAGQGTVHIGEGRVDESREYCGLRE